MTATQVAALPQARHVLVVATQCPAIDRPMPDLVAVADELHGVLTDPDLGACQDAGVTGAALVRSGSADRATVDAAVRAAIVRAGEARAVLVLAFLGHGQSAKEPHLYYLAADSLPDQSVTAVDVNGLIKVAVGHPHLAGLVVLLDTCQSGAGLPSTGSLVGGFSEGQTRVSVLAAAPAQEPAFDLDFSVRIVHHVREGFHDAGDFVSMRHYRAALAADLPLQDPLALEYNGVATAAEEELWLAKNSRRGPVSAAAGLGTIGADQLASALKSWPQDAADGGDRVRDAADLAALRDRAAQSDEIGALRVYEVADALLLVRETELFLITWAGLRLTPYDVRRAMVELNAGSDWFRTPLTAPAELSAGELMRHFLEDAALQIPHGGGRGRPYARALARCLVAVGHVCGLDTSGEQVQKWGEAHDLTLELTDARRWADGLRAQSGASLVVSLHAALTDWPDSLTVWLRRDDTCSNAHSVACAPSREGVEAALPEVLNWAEEQLPPDVRLTHVDMVVRAALLAKWRPEDADDGLYRLGADRSVVLRWADRLFVPRHFRTINKRARQNLEACRQYLLSTGDAPVWWVNAASNAEVAALREYFRTGQYPLAVGITHRSAVFTELLQTLLPYTPVLLWPDEETGAVIKSPAALARLWERLPADFIRGQRLRWTAGDAKMPDVAVPTPESAELVELALLRAAWHDLPWLDFCDAFRERAPMSAGGSQ
ncbi:vWA-MoxR associated conflict system protein [Streptomyces erythrochromogenes]|uniref:vWA-MoxR associated conflict system protein n=1 Tax=Streptomyces erythrochromogenes TaxID=285574 RepID=UPI00381AC122